ncbi:MAG: hypothetical protein AAF721_37090 [Myxococcota bacterium]
MLFRKLCVGAVLIGLGACDAVAGEASGEAKGEGAPERSAAAPGSSEASGDSNDAASKAAPEVATIALGALERRPAASSVDAAGRPIDGTVRGPIAWKPPSQWDVRRDAGKPFILGEYGLPGHTEERPALCRLISSVSRTSGKTIVEQAEREAKRTRLRDDDGKSLLSTLSPTVETHGEHQWHVVYAEGRYRAPGTFGKVDPDQLLPGYAQLNLVPGLKDVPFALRCWAPAETMKAHAAVMRAWAATVHYPDEA